MSNFPAAVPFVPVESPPQLILKLTSDVQDWRCAVDLRKQNCDISVSQKPIIWFPEVWLKFISGFNTVLGLSELLINFR